MKLKSFVLFFLSLLALLSTAIAQPSQALMRYSWGNQLQSSQLTLFIDGSIEHTEWSNFKLSKVPEKKLSSAELEIMKGVIDEVSLAKIYKKKFESRFGERSGTIEILVEGQMLPIDGILKNEKGATELKNESPDLIKIKEFLKSYVSQIHL
jgi:hypothetical protein